MPSENTITASATAACCASRTRNCAGVSGLADRCSYKRFITCDLEIVDFRFICRSNSSINRQSPNRQPPNPWPGNHQIDNRTSSWSGGKASDIDAVLADLVVDHPLGSIEQSRRLRAVTACRFERVLNQVLLEAGNRVAQRHAGHGTGGFGGLQRRRQVMTVNDLAIAHQHGAFERVLELADV